MSQKVTKFKWTAKRLRAAELLAEDRLSDRDIADELDMSRAQLTRWKQVPEFAEKVAEIAAKLEAAILARGIARKVRRVKQLDERWQAMQAVIRERSEDPDMQGVPGGKTGLLVRTRKAIGFGVASEVVDEYAVDTALLRELREHEKQAAQELGQWTEKQEVSGKDGGPVLVKVLGGKASMGDL